MDGDREALDDEDEDAAYNGCKVHRSHKDPHLTAELSSESVEGPERSLAHEAKKTEAEDTRPVRSKPLAPRDAAQQTANGLLKLHKDRDGVIPPGVFESLTAGSGGRLADGVIR